MHNLDAPMTWPDVPRLCFGEGEPWHLNARVAMALLDRRQMTPYIEGYRTAAAALLDSAADRGAIVDFLIFPISFLWRHHLELALKQIIAVGRQLDGKAWGFTKGHDLLKLWNDAKPHVVKCGDPTAPELSNVEANILEFAKIDPGSDGFRYPMGSDLSTPSLPGAPELVNLRVLHEAMEAVANFLSAVNLGLSVMWERHAEVLLASRQTR